MCNIHALLVCLESRLDIKDSLVISYHFKHSVLLCQFRKLLFYPFPHTLAGSRKCQGKQA